MHNLNVIPSMDTTEWLLQLWTVYPVNVFSFGKFGKCNYFHVQINVSKFELCGPGGPFQKPDRRSSLKLAFGQLFVIFILKCAI